MVQNTCSGKFCSLIVEASYWSWRSVVLLLCICGCQLQLPLVNRFRFALFTLRTVHRSALDIVELFLWVCDIFDFDVLGSFSEWCSGVVQVVIEMYWIQCASIPPVWMLVSWIVPLIILLPHDSPRRVFLRNNCKGTGLPWGQCLVATHSVGSCAHWCFQYVEACFRREVFADNVWSHFAAELQRDAQVEFGRRYCLCLYHYW